MRLLSGEKSAADLSALDTESGVRTDGNEQKLEPLSKKAKRLRDQGGNNCTGLGRLGS